MNITRNRVYSEAAKEETAVVGWWLVAKRELTDLWLGGRAMIFLLLFSILLGITSFLLASNNELRLLPPQEMLFLIVQISMVVSLFISLLIGADSISGERERATLEGLLLVPTSRRQIVVGKFLAAMSIWPAALLIATIHLAILSPNGRIFNQALLLGASLGTLLVVGFTAFGVLVSLGSISNRTSLFVSLFVAVLFLMPTQFPGTAQTGFMGRFVKRINPMESVNQILEKMLVNNRTFAEMASWLAAPVIFTLLTVGLLFWFAAPRLDLDGTKIKLSLKRKRAVNVFVGFCLVLAASFSSPMSAKAQSAVDSSPLQITIDTSYKEAKTGDEIDFTTSITNVSDQASPPIVVAMNLVNLGIGDPVDPEDWSPERTQEIETLAPGETVDLDWTINAILEGDYLAYMVVIPAPDGAQATSLPVASPGIHLTVAQFTPLNPGGIAPIAFGIPVLLALLLALQMWLRRKRIDSSHAQPLPV